MVHRNNKPIVPKKTHKRLLLKHMYCGSNSDSILYEAPRRRPEPDEIDMRPRTPHIIYADINEDTFRGVSVIFHPLPAATVCAPNRSAHILQQS